MFFLNVGIAKSICLTGDLILNVHFNPLHDITLKYSVSLP